MKALVTGATGFVGSAVLRALLDEGFEVRALVRPESDRRNLEGLDVEISEGSLQDAASLRRAVEGCPAVFHVAADYRLWVPDPRAMYACNVDGTRELMRAALDAGVERVVYTSSVAVLGLVPKGVADEDTPSSLEDMVGHYKRSKFLAEQEVRRMAAEESLPVVIVNPAAPIGPRDVKPTPTGRTILDAAAGRMPAYVDTGLNVVHVDDVARGHLLAHQRGRVGERYVLGERNMSLKEILDEVARLVGRNPPRVRLPANLILPVAYAVEAWARVSGSSDPRVTVDAVRMSKKQMYFSAEKARRELGFEPRSAVEAIRDAVVWFREAGYLPRSEQSRAEARV